MKKIIVTGASSGLGSYIANELQNDKNLVINLSRKKKNFVSFPCELSNVNQLNSVFRSNKKKI